MKILDEILKEAERAGRQDDLPDAVLAQIKEICAGGDKYADKEILLEELLERLEDYEPFADVGCGNESYSTADVQMTVNRILDI